MQAEANIVERIAQAYIAHRGVRALSILLVLGSDTLLFLLAGGFPPFAWRLLVQTLPQIPALAAARRQRAPPRPARVCVVSGPCHPARVGPLPRRARLSNVWVHDH